MLRERKSMLHKRKWRREETHLSELVGTFRVLGEPAFLYSFFLFENFLNGPERREGENTQQGRQQNVVDTHRSSCSPDTQQKEYPPASGTPVIFGLYHDGVEQADDEERTDADEQSGKMVCVQKIHDLFLRTDRYFFLDTLFQ